MKTLIVTLIALMSANAMAAEYKPGSLQELVAIRGAIEKTDAALYYVSMYTNGKGVEGTPDLSRGKAQVILWYLCKDVPELTARINSVEAERHPELAKAKKALEYMYCEVNPDKLEFTNLRELAYVEKKFRAVRKGLENFVKEKMDK